MRVLLLSDWMSNTGGAEKYMIALRDSLVEQGDDTRLLFCGPGDRAAGDMRAYGSDSLAAKAMLQIVNPFAVSKVKLAVREFRPDVALVSQFAYHLSPAVLPALGDVPAVVTMMDYKAICPLGTRLLPDGSICRVRAGLVCNGNGCVSLPHWLRDRPRYASINKGIAGARRVICPSAWMRKEMSDAGIESTLVPLGVPDSRIAADVPASEPVFVYAGRFSREKGVALLIAAFAKIRSSVPSARLRLVGDGPLRRELHALTSALGVADSVEFTGWSDHDRVHEAFRDAWACVCPSLWAEPFGLVAVESISMGVPVIASDSGGFRETVTDAVTGLLFETGIVGSLAERMLSVATGAAFPSHRLSPDVVERSRESYCMSLHARRLRQVLEEVVIA
jgi:glycosyltransferase involved in cell wall biosynthesis